MYIHCAQCARDERTYLEVSDCLHRPQLDDPRVVHLRHVNGVLVGLRGQVHVHRHPQLGQHVHTWGGGGQPNGDKTGTAGEKKSTHKLTFALKFLF